MAVETPRFLQTKQYSAKALRAILLDGPLQSGVVNAGDLMVTQRAAGGAAMFVDVAAGAAWIKGSVSARQGVYNVYNDATITLAVPGNASGNPRVDSVIARVYDTVDGAGAQDAGTIEYVQGTATAGATTTNRNGAPGGTGGPALPASCVVLGDVAVASGAASITNAVIRDRRPWAKGAFVRIVRNSNAAAGNDYTTAGAAAALIDATNLQPRIECSGAPLVVTLNGAARGSAAAGIDFTPSIDGVADTTRKRRLDVLAGTAGEYFPVSISWVLLPAAGSHLIGPSWATSAGTASLLAQATFDTELIIRESPGQNTANNTTTTG